MKCGPGYAEGLAMCRSQVTLSLLLLLLGLAITALSLFAGITPAAPVPTHLLSKKPLLYFPTTVGSKWVYQRGEEEWTEVVTAVEERDGVFVVTFGILSKSGSVNSPWKMAVSASGLAEVEGKEIKLDSSHLRLKLPHKPDETWVNEELGLTYRSLKPERVKVPAGEFEALRVMVEDGHQDEETRWYAERIGLVKSKGVGRKPPVVLKSFTPGKE